jgi:hypothetical protein
MTCHKLATDYLGWRRGKSREAAAKKPRKEEQFRYSPTKAAGCSDDAPVSGSARGFRLLSRPILMGT